jgi:hypothetical protein
LEHIIEAVRKFRDEGGRWERQPEYMSLVKWYFVNALVGIGDRELFAAIREEMAEIVDRSRPGRPFKRYVEGPHNRFLAFFSEPVVNPKLMKFKHNVSVRGLNPLTFTFTQIGRFEGQTSPEAVSVQLFSTGLNGRPSELVPVVKTGKDSFSGSININHFQRITINFMIKNESFGCTVWVDWKDKRNPQSTTNCQK